jgi:hypothetical protein
MIETEKEVKDEFKIKTWIRKKNEAKVNENSY